MMLAANMFVGPAIDWMKISPLLVMLGGVLLLILGGSLTPQWKKGAYGIVGALTAAGAAVLTAMMWRDLGNGEPTTLIANALTYSKFSLFATFTIAVGTLLAIFVTSGFLVREGEDGPEVFALILSASIGGMVMVQANDLIVMFLGLETLSLAFYLLTASSRSRTASGEAGLKYFVLGGFASAFFLYGVALVFGATGSTNIDKIATSLSANTVLGGSSTMLLAGIALLLVGFGFKVSLVPFHTWTADVYQGAPTPFTGFMAYVLTARDAIGGLYQDTGERRETAGLAYRFSDFIMLTDVPHGHVDTGEEQRPNFADPRPGTPPLGMERAFVSPTGRRPGGWENIPVFASVASNCVLWDGLTVGIENAESRRNQLFAALNTPVPLGYDPNYPEVGVVNVATGAKWPSLDVPRWAPRFWRAARPEYDRVQELIEGFIRDAGKWRHAMLVTHQDRRDHTPTQAHAALDAYERDLNAIERTVLDDSSLEGFFDPLNRIYDRADSNIRILLAPPPETAATPMSTEDAIAAAKPPADAMTNADTQLVRAIERKINPLLLLQVLVMTVIICTTVLSWILIGLRSSYYGSFGAISAFWEDSLRQVRGIGPDALTLENPRFKALVELIQDEWFVGKLQQPWLKAFPWKIPGIGSWLADLPEPSQIVLISALIFGVPLVAIGIFTALRQRVKLEQAWRVIYRRATAWRDNIAHRFPKDIEALEAAINRQSLESARDILRRRRAELEAFRILGLTPFTASIDDPHTITKTLRAGIPGVQGLSDLQVVQTIARFKREAASLPSQRWTAGYLLDMLRAQAAEVAGDVVPSLGDELPVHRRTILTSMPPDGAVRRPPCATTDPHGFAPPAVVRFLSVPGEVIEPFVRTNPDLVTVLPLPIEDRFYTVVIQSGLTASNLFSCTDTWEASTPDRNGGAA